MSSSPFDLLSTEVIQEIFLLCLPKYNRTLLPKEYYHVQIVISQVSSRWRSIALNTLQLWDNVILSVKDNWLEQSALQLASLWFDRAGSLPIALKVWSSLSQHQLDHYIQDLYRLMASHRFKCLTGDLKLFYLPLHNKSYEASFASLESLSLDIPKQFSVDPSQAGQSPDGDNYCQLPSLRYLSLTFRYINIPWKAVLPMIQWHKLTKLILYDIMQVTMIEIMRECKALVECDLSVIRHSNEDVVPISTSLPHLRNLRLCSSSLLPSSDLIKILSTFKVPNLTSMFVVFPASLEMNHSFGTELLSRNLDAPLQQLQEFTFIDTHTINVRMILPHMPSLRKLDLRVFVSLDHDTANEISTGQLGPHIDTLYFGYCSSARRVLDMIEKRQENAKSDEGRNLAPFVHVKLTCQNSGDKYKERVERLEHQYNVRIQMYSMRVYGDDDSEEED